MLNNKLTLVYFPLVFIFTFFLSSCSFFATPETLNSCSNPSSPNIVDSLTTSTGIISLVDVDINGITVQKWVILPVTPSATIYVPCNLPIDARVKSREFEFSANVYDHSPNAGDTVLTGFTFIELTYLQRN
jgi:hypothetical protein